MLGRSPEQYPGRVGLGKLLHGGDGAYLLHHTQRVVVVPGFHKLSAREAVYAYAPNRHLAAPWLYNPSARPDGCQVPSSGSHYLLFPSATWSATVM
jgi:hypothetical protein